MAAKPMKTMSFVTTEEIEQMLKDLAEREDRSVSYILRKILEKELKRRQNENKEKK